MTFKNYMIFPPQNHINPSNKHQNLYSATKTNQTHSTTEMNSKLAAVEHKVYHLGYKVSNSAANQGVWLFSPSWSPRQEPKNVGNTGSLCLRKQKAAYKACERWFFSFPLLFVVVFGWLAPSWAMLDCFFAKKRKFSMCSGTIFGGSCVVWVIFGSCWVVFMDLNGFVVDFWLFFGFWIKN